MSDINEINSEQNNSSEIDVRKEIPKIDPMLNVNLGLADPVYASIKSHKNTWDIATKLVDEPLKENLSPEWYNGVKNAEAIVSTAGEAIARINNPTYGIVENAADGINKSINNYNNKQQLIQKYNYTINGAQYDGGTISVGDKVVIEGYTYTVKGYVNTDDGQKRIIYYRPGWNEDHYCCIDSDGNLKRVGVIDGKYKIDDGPYRDIYTDGAFEPSQNDKQFFGKYNGSETSNSTPTTGDSSGTTTVNNNFISSSRCNFSYTKVEDLASLLTSRRRYYVKYYDINDKYTKDYYHNDPYDSTQWRAPFDAYDRRYLAIDVYNWTIGQGKKAEELSIMFEKHIGNIRRLLTIVYDDTQEAIYIVTNNGPSTGLRQQAHEIIERLDNVVSSVYQTLYNKALEPAITWCNTAQEEANERIREVAEDHRKLYIYVS